MDTTTTTTTTATATENAQATRIPPINAPPPFLSKTYDMVDDAATDGVVSWSQNNSSFVVWNPPEFARDLLPKYFKHNNFSSFVRQLNTYGFRKVDSDRWEFANEGFLKGKKHLLKSISRRKPSHGHQNQQTHAHNSSVGACVEVGKFGLEEELERLKRDKNVLTQELVRLKHQQQTTDNQMHTLVNRLQGMEQRQQQMMSFLAKAVQSPGFLAQFVQQQSESNRCISEANKKRRLKPDDSSSSMEIPLLSDGQIVKYQPCPLGNDEVHTLSDNFFIGDKAKNSVMKTDDPPNRNSGVTLEEVPPTVLGVGNISPEVSSSPDIVENSDDIQGDYYMVNKTGDDEFLDLASIELNGSVLADFDIDKFSIDPEFASWLDDSIWEQLSSSNKIHFDSNVPELSAPKSLPDGHQSEEGRDKCQIVDQLTEQMNLLNSDNRS